MASLSKTASPAPATPSPAAAPSSPAEHIYIGSEDLSADPAIAARTLRETVVLRNPIRHTGAELTLYDEGYLKVTEVAKGTADAPFFLDLRFVDPVPKIERVIAVRWLTAALGCGAADGVGRLLAAFRRVPHRSHGGARRRGACDCRDALRRRLFEPREHRVLHACTGVRPCCELVANLGSIKKFRAFVPMLCASDRGGRRANRRRHGRLSARRDARALSAARRRRARQRRVRERHRPHPRPVRRPALTFAGDLRASGYHGAE